MKLSTLETTSSTEAILYGVEADAEILNPPPTLEQVGLLWKGRPDCINDTLVDAIIQFGLSGMNVILEILPDDDVDPAYILTLAGNAGFSVALIHEAGKDDAWFAKCTAFAEALFDIQNFSREIHPVTGYLSFLFAERTNGIAGMYPTDRYMIRRFLAAIPDSTADLCKNHMKTAFQERFGGADAFNDFLDEVVAGIAREAGRLLEETTRARPNA